MEKEMLDAYRFFLMRMKMSGMTSVPMKDLDMFELELRKFVPEG